MEDDVRKKTGCQPRQVQAGQPRSSRFSQSEVDRAQAGQGNEPPTSPSPAEKLTWWNGEEMTFIGIIDL